MQPYFLILPQPAGLSHVLPTCFLPVGTHDGPTVLPLPTPPSRHGGRGVEGSSGLTDAQRPQGESGEQATTPAGRQCGGQGQGSVGGLL